MPRILLVKTSSLGDVVHNYPVVTDIHRWIPGADVHWAVEENFRLLPALHPGVARVFPVALRRWRKSLLQAACRREISQMRDAIQAQSYDVVIDTQGLLKSALVCALAHGRKVGFDWKSAREPLGLFYHETHRVARSVHAVERNRALAAKALGYRPEGSAEFGVRADAKLIDHDDWYLGLRGRHYCVFLHSTSADSKLWPEHQWSKLGAYVAGKGLQVVLPWASNAEHERSTRLAQLIPRAVVPPHLPLDKMAALLGGASLAAGVDTGLTHLAAALGTPTLGIYCATSPRATGVYGSRHVLNIGTGKAAPALGEVLDGLARVPMPS
ncbi:MAG: lipopolysaccharide heptosyltransferase I [Betaproteobacteria bacterium]|nr:lipopolysaccharide heptosyltransferase I [Betaproteobacteria bacterium]